MRLYSAEEIADLWEKYQSSHVWRVLRDGKWKVYFKKPDTGDGATRVDMVKASQVYSFPEYLEVVNG